ncbi:type II toxin-antitoxin system RelE/ParE family toxin [Pelistega suis]|uniref:Type II toxin-antitoxin system RelE/ParE family toxin n=1 Tax=Pelistega suis TaxID=1631957 RepID=A0A849P6R2_9BURK|nr:type II toxin-antitoxin system RelE/ParE family toxin [Pelistega suis]
MNKIFFYCDSKGREPVKEIVVELSSQNSKDSRIRLSKIRDYIQVLKEHGIHRACEPYIKHVGENAFILLHIFIKKTMKTPKSEIERAKTYLDDFYAREVSDE